MNTTLLISIGAAALTSVALFTVLLAARAFLRPSDVSSRLDVYLSDDLAFDGHPEQATDPRLAERLNSAITRRSFADIVARDLAQANVPLTVPEYLLLRLAVPLVLAAVSLIIWRTVLVVPLALMLGWLLPVLWLRSRRRRRNRDFEEQLAETLTLMAASLRGGFSLPQAIANAAKESIEPTKSELRRVTQEMQLGLSLNQALDNLLRRMESEDLDLVVTAIKIHSRVGGNLTNILETISTTVRERAKLRREIRVITSMQRLSSYIIGLLPLILAVIIFTLNPRYMMRIFQPGWALCMPIGAAIMSAVGFLIIRRIVDIKV